MKQCLTFIENLDWYAIGMVAILASFAILLYRMQKSPSNFHVDDLFLSRGKADASKLAFMVAQAVMTWALIFLTLNGKLTEWYTTAYVGAFVLALLGTGYNHNKYHPEDPPKEERHD